MGCVLFVRILELCRANFPTLESLVVPLNFGWLRRYLESELGIPAVLNNKNEAIIVFPKKTLMEDH